MEGLEVEMCFTSMLQALREQEKGRANFEAGRLLQHFVEDGDIPSNLLHDLTKGEMRFIIHTLAQAARAMQ